MGAPYLQGMIEQGDDAVGVVTAPGKTTWC
jgi:hypothetical protein